MEAQLYPNLTARENLRVRTTLLGLPESRIDEVLAAVDLAGSAGKKRAGRFSIGMRQRLGLALALIAPATPARARRPATALDPIGIEELRDQIRGFAAAGTTVMVSSHILSEVQQMADTIGIIYGGRLPTRMRFGPGRTSRNFFMSVCPGRATSARGGGGMTGEKGGLLAGLRAEALKSRHAAPVAPGRAHGAADAAARRDALPGRADLQRVELLGTRSSCPCLSRSWWRASRGRTLARGCGGFWAWASRLGAPGGPRRSGASLSARSRTSWSSAVPRGIGVLLAGPHGRGHAHDAPLHSR